MNSVLLKILSLTYPIPVINCNISVGNWGHIIFPSLSILGIFMICPAHKIKYFTLTIRKAQEKIKNFQNIVDKKIHFTVLKCSKYKQPFKSVSWSDSGRILSGRSKNNSNEYSLYLESLLYKTSNFPHKQCLWYAEQDESHSNFILCWKMS